MTCMSCLKKGVSIQAVVNNMHQLVPRILSEEVKKSEARDFWQKSFNDGTTHMAKPFVLILQFIGDNRELKQRVVSFHLLSKSLNG